MECGTTWSHPSCVPRGRPHVATATQSGESAKARPGSLMSGMDDRPEEHPATPRAVFDAHYYAHDCGIPYERNEHWLAFFGHIADEVVKEIAP